MRPCCTLWIGPALGRCERACLRSVVRQGHRLTLYCYDEVQGIPEGVEVRDASEILPRERIIRHRRGSVALFSNWFRYELQRLGRGIWVDADYYLVAPLDFDQPYIYGIEDDAGYINTAVLLLPQDSVLVTSLLSLFDQAEVPPWLPLRHRLSAALRLRRTGRTDVSRMPWGSTGPRALTALAHRHGLDRWALPREILYPLRGRRVACIRDPSCTLEQILHTTSKGLHLWNEAIKTWKEEPAAPGSFLARLHEEGS